MALQETRRLTLQEWSQQSRDHFTQVHSFAQAARKRASRREKHPVYDFLTRYYPFSLGKFEKWQPGVGVRLEQADQERFSPSRYTYASDGSCYLDPMHITDKERSRHEFTLRLLQNTQGNKPVLSCYGLHEWAMVYTGADVRHRETAPLRLSQEEVDAVVRSRPLVCTHFDAYRFFAPEAQPLNRLQPSLEDRLTQEQPGCIHANMDLYKWASKSSPWVGSELVWDCFQLALRARTIDMQASPYDLSEWGYEPIRIESEEGRALYQQKQQELQHDGVTLRSRLIDTLSSFLS